MRTAPLLLAAALLAAPVPTFAQQTTNDIVYGSDDTSERDNDGNSRLGLLGLLGLAGLLGLMRREPDIHVDARGGSAADDR
jgi:MYXO-CTERM domain-containing protein